MRRLIPVLFLLLSLTSKAQTGFKSSDTLLKLSATFLDVKLTDSVKLVANERFIEIMEKSLIDTSSFDMSFADLKNISIQADPEGKFRIFTWLVITSEGYKPMGFIQVKEGKHDEIEVFRLNSQEDVSKSIQYRTLSTDKWLGMLYYELIPVQYKKEKYYVLLGFSGNNGITHKKVIDVLFFSGNTPKFGKPVFFDENDRMQNRVVFEYSATAKMSVKYDEKAKRVTFDHLAPSEPVLVDQYQFYGPDFKIYAYELNKKGEWKLKMNVDARNDDENLGTPGIPYMTEEEE